MNASASMRFALGLMLYAALAACARLGADGTGNAAAPRADAAPTTAAAQPAAGPVAPAPDAHPAYEFYLLTRAGRPVEDPRIVSTMEAHPCGPIDLVRVSAIPVDDPVFMPSWVVEFDAGGKELMRWGIPNEAEVTALAGNRLQFRTDGQSYWVTVAGQLERAATAPGADAFLDQSGMFECPALPKFAGSGAEQCFRVRDSAGTLRRIAMEGVCS